MFIGLWNFSDDNGVFAGSAKTIKIKIFPGDDHSLNDIGVLIEELVSAGLIESYEVNEKPYLFSTGWAKHQKINRPQPSDNPLPQNAKQRSNGSGGEDDNHGFTDHSVNTHGTSNEHSLGRGKDTERKGKDTEGGSVPKIEVPEKQIQWAEEWFAKNNPALLSQLPVLVDKFINTCEVDPPKNINARWRSWVMNEKPGSNNKSSAKSSPPLKEKNYQEGATKLEDMPEWARQAIGGVMQ